MHKILCLFLVAAFGFSAFGEGKANYTYGSEDKLRRRVELMGKEADALFNALPINKDNSKDKIIESRQIGTSVWSIRCIKGESKIKFNKTGKELDMPTTGEPVICSVDVSVRESTQLRSVEELQSYRSKSRGNQVFSFKAGEEIRIFVQLKEAEDVQRIQKAISNTQTNGAQKLALQNQKLTISCEAQSCLISY